LNAVNESIDLQSSHPKGVCNSTVNVVDVEHSSSSSSTSSLSHSSVDASMQLEKAMHDSLSDTQFHQRDDLLGGHSAVEKEITGYVVVNVNGQGDCFPHSYLVACGQITNIDADAYILRQLVADYHDHHPPSSIASVDYAAFADRNKKFRQSKMYFEQHDILALENVMNTRVDVWHYNHTTASLCQLAIMEGERRPIDPSTTVKVLWNETAKHYEPIVRQDHASRTFDYLSANSIIVTDTNAQTVMTNLRNLLETKYFNQIPVTSVLFPCTITIIRTLF
jgi:hypothetical protein